MFCSAVSWGRGTAGLVEMQRLEAPGDALLCARVPSARRGSPARQQVRGDACTGGEGASARCLARRPRERRQQGEKGCEANSALITCNRTGLVFRISRAWHGANRFVLLWNPVPLGSYFCKARSRHRGSRPPGTTALRASRFSRNGLARVILPVPRPRCWSKGPPRSYSPRKRHVLLVLCSFNRAWEIEGIPSCS